MTGKLYKNRFLIVEASNYNENNVVTGPENIN